MNEHFRFEAFRDGDLLGVSTVIRWWNPRTWFAWRIQRDTRSPYNHVGILRWRADQWFVLEALWGGGVVQTPLLDYQREGVRLTVGGLELDPLQRLRITRFAVEKLGCGYDIIKIIKIRLLQMILGNKAAVDSLITDEHDNLLICSELVVRAYRAAGIVIGGDYAGPGHVMSQVAAYRGWTGRRWI